MTNPVLKAIKERRSVKRFETTLIEEAKIQAILEAGRWAPSWINSQPWRFILTADRNLKRSMSRYVPTIFNRTIREAPICIVVCVNAKEDPYHFVEDGAAATQNMALAAQSLELGSCWIGVYDLKNNENSAEEGIRKILEIPKSYRVISLLPVGVPKYAEQKARKELSQLVHYDHFRNDM